MSVTPPCLKCTNTQSKYRRKKIGLQKALALPKPEVGYHSQGILGQSYKGFNIGSSIPLWKNRNRVKAEKANLGYNQLQLVAHRTEHRNENKRLYEQYIDRKSALEEYEQVMSTLNNSALLMKALQLG